MGYIAHDTVLAATWREGDKARILAFRDTLLEKWQHLLVGPVHAMTNGDDFWAFMPDGSKERWDTSNQGDDYRKAFIALLDELGVDYVCVRWGGDWAYDHGNSIETED